VSVFNKNTRRVLSYSPTISYGSRKRGYDQGGCVRRGEVDHRIRRITSSPSQTQTLRFRRRLVRTTDDGRRRECSTLAAVRPASRLCFSHCATRTVDNTVDLYAAKPDIRPESRFLNTPPAFKVPVRGGGSRRNIAFLFGMKN